MGKADDYHQRVLDVITELITLDPAADSPEGRLLAILADAAEEFEREQYPIGCPECRGTAFHKMDCSRRGEPLP